jgi:hypothetical protein
MPGLIRAPFLWPRPWAYGHLVPRPSTLGSTGVTTYNQWALMVSKSFYKRFETEFLQGSIGPVCLPSGDKYPLHFMSLH